ncbi:hypothetical protein [Bradyrhizobium sp. CCBAU 25338]|uniref:hypothetical protein n=1 Tax=Bradyrhizobium sp. CCBAU 25338 TaxID=1641877 RepID=UPI002304289E|nr:hypothetical protein [Bradyrhizobium sp. CCBAU 25338]MDA9530346.1 hypothetical protein [Bradyrhizobium sp. CCBAU 25338]
MTKSNASTLNLLESAHQAASNCISDAAGWLSEVPDNSAQRISAALAEYAAATAPARIAEGLASVRGRPYAALINEESIRAGAADALREALLAA